MHLIRGLSNIRESHQQSILTIGNFDGIHLGHQTLLKTIAEKAHQANTKSMVMLFEPSPAEYFSKTPPARLTRIGEKLQLIRAFDIDYILRLAFNQTFSLLSADAFVEQILVKHLRIQQLVIGDDFRYGHQRQGDMAHLQQAANHFGFELTQLASVENKHLRISSSQIRLALQQGDLDQAQQLLGRGYTMSGRVIHGQKRGRLLGVPTANIHPKRLSCPLTGVYLVKVYHREFSCPAVAHIGKQPTVNGERELLEVHLLNFSGDLYGQRLNVEFLRKVRDVEKFDNLDALTVAMNQDIQIAKQFFDLTE